MFWSNSSRRLLVWVGAVGLTVAGLAVTTTPAWSSSDVQQCYVAGVRPYQSGSLVYGRADRVGCGDYVELQAWIMQDRTLWPDPNIGYGARWLVNGSVTGAGPCPGRGDFYTSARTHTGQRHDSQRAYQLC